MVDFWNMNERAKKSLLTFKDNIGKWIITYSPKKKLVPAKLLSVEDVDVQEMANAIAELEFLDGSKRKVRIVPTDKIEFFETSEGAMESIAERSER